MSWHTFRLHRPKLKYSNKNMNNTNKYIVLVVASLLLLADKATAFPAILGSPVQIPDGGATALLLVAGLAGLGLIRRFGRTK